jgi:hypothetical protein
VHFIWSGNGKHSKRQRMREAMLYHGARWPRR